VADRGPQARARSQREARALARLSHPNVVAVYDVGTAGDTVYVAMERIDGPTLADWLAQRPRTRDEILHVFLQAGRGLAAAHDAGLVHRDFKPSNVMLGDRVRVVEFGLARSEVATDPPLDPSFRSTMLEVTVTATGNILGTPAYMAPEQRTGGKVERAIELDPTYAPAHAMLAQAHAWHCEWYGGGEAERTAAELASQKALAFGPELAESHVARGAVLSARGEYEPAERAFGRAIELDSRNFDAHYLYARLCFQMGRHEDAIRLFYRGAQIRPEDFQCMLLIHTPAQCLGRLDEASRRRVKGFAARPVRWSSIPTTFVPCRLVASPWWRWARPSRRWTGHVAPSRSARMTRRRW
jgi:hypothetical protein